MIELAWLIPVFPVIGVLINGLFGRHVGERAGPIASVMAGLSLLVVLGIAFQMIFGTGGSHTVHLWTWVEAGSFRASMSFLIDPLSTIMLLVVAGVGFLVHVYAVGYMHGDPGYPRFFTYLNLFMLSMFLLVLGTTISSCSSAGRAWAFAAICSSGSGTRNNPHPTRARRRSSSTASATRAFCSACSSSGTLTGSLNLRRSLQGGARDERGGGIGRRSSAVRRRRSARARRFRSTSGCPTPWEGPTPGQRPHPRRPPW